MAAFNKFNDFAEQLCLAKHNLNTDALHVYLSNATPSASLDAVKADLAEIAAGNGYTADGIDTLNTFAESAGNRDADRHQGRVDRIGRKHGGISICGLDELHADIAAQAADWLVGLWIGDPAKAR